jgi:biopolymer transport protein ExbD
MKVRRKKKSAPEMPTSALSDIALLLLIFFIVTTEFLVQRSIPAELPAITPEKEEASEDLITVVVAEDFLYLDEERIHMEELAPYLAAKLADRVSREERAIVLDARATVRYQRVVRAASAIKKAGGVITMMEVEE